MKECAERKVENGHEQEEAWVGFDRVIVGPRDKNGWHQDRLGLAPTGEPFRGQQSISTLLATSFFVIVWLGSWHACFLGQTFGALEGKESKASGSPGGCQVLRASCRGLDGCHSSAAGGG